MIACLSYFGGAERSHPSHHNKRCVGAVFAFKAINFWKFVDLYLTLGRLIALESRTFHNPEMKVIRRARAVVESRYCDYL